MMTHCEQQTSKDSTQRPKYRVPSKFPVIDGVRYFPGTTKDFLQHIKNLPLRGDEVIVASYPKAGTTWVSEILWQIFSEGEIDMTPIHQRVPFLEASNFLDHFDTPEKYIEYFLNKPHPRVFKTHLQYSLTPMGGENLQTRPKYINVIRNPKDCAVSKYHHVKNWKYNEFDGPWDELFETFIDGEVKFGSWFDHVLGWWAHRDDPNILILKYEDMKKDLPSAVKQIAKFVGKDLSEETIQLIAKQTSFQAMSTGDGRFYDGDEEFAAPNIKPNMSKFIRKGEVGDWKNYFTEEQSRRLDELYEKKMAGSGLELEFE